MGYVSFQGCSMLEGTVLVLFWETFFQKGPQFQVEWYELMWPQGYPKTIQHLDVMVWHAPRYLYFGVTITPLKQSGNLRRIQLEIRGETNSN